MYKVRWAFKCSTYGFPYSVQSAASCTSEVSCHETNNHIEMWFELNYHEGSELFVCVLVTLDKGVTNQPSEENKASV
jgi:sulfur relay (sulfurtransferase) complex TusBCD TusD component (DsrE family)